MFYGLLVWQSLLDNDWQAFSQFIASWLINWLLRRMDHILYIVLVFGVHKNLLVHCSFDIMGFVF